MGVFMLLWKESTRDDARFTLGALCKLRRQ